MSFLVMSVLNKAQKQAIEYTEGPLLIVAGAGTGKTTVITEKIAYLIEQKLAKPEEILALTFTEKAAGEMHERVDKLIEVGYADIQISTFHAFCQRLLERYALDIGLPNQFKMLTETDTWLLVRRNLDKFNLDYYRPLGNPVRHIHELIKHFSKCKDELITPEEYLKYAQEKKLDTDNVEYESEVKRLTEVADAYHVYNQLLLENNALDFGDLIAYAIRLLEKRSPILRALQERFKYILVDEFQDVNWAQYYLVQMMTGKKGQLTVVGDDDQCLPGDTKILIPGGTKPIKKLKVGDKVLTAVGKGFYATSLINAIKKTKKRNAFITINTEKGRKLTLTDNHVVFCLTPQESDKKYYYVYLMQKQDWGWRMGITNDLAVRLRLERGADRIFAVKQAENETEARFYETLLSLKFNIPTVCFKEREGSVQKTDWLRKVFNAIDTDDNVKKLAQELNLDLNSHHYCLGGVKRGQSRRIKINLVMCSRNYGSKFHKHYELTKPRIGHTLRVETSDRKAVDTIRKLGLKIVKTKKGYRLRMQSADLFCLEKIAAKVLACTDGIIERKFNLGRLDNRTVDSLMMPAKNLHPGLYVPIFTFDKGVIMDRIVKIQQKTRKVKNVYDIEVDRTHNYVANGIVVHNSIYAFRGASVSNIMRFKDDFPQSKEVVLTENYRSQQEILDEAYKLIQNNNPDRLEVKLKIDKRLKTGKGSLDSARDDKKVKAVVHLHSVTLDDEVKQVVDEILRLKDIDQEAVWDDFAILVRANNHAEPFINALEKRGVPYEFLASAGLYRQPIVLDCINFFKTIIDQHESAAIFRFLNLPFLQFSDLDLRKFTSLCKKKTISYYEGLKRINEFGLTKEGIGVVEKVLQIINEGMRQSRWDKPTAALYNFLEKSGYLKYLTSEEDRGNRAVIRQIYQLKQFFEELLAYEAATPDAKAHDWLAHFEYVSESGEKGALYQPTETPDSVNILTVHGAKGLEFKYVFVVNLVEERFPIRGRGEPIEIPVELIKEQLPEGDSHYQEERRLFYVAMTRAKERLYLTSASDYGGLRSKKISRFLDELGYVAKEVAEQKEKSALGLPGKKTEPKEGEFIFELPKTFSFSQLKSYTTCPYQYKLAYILKIPSKGNASFSFGQTMHSTLQAFYLAVQELNKVKQVSLFGPIESKTPADKIKVPALEELLTFYDRCWIDDWYASKAQREEYYRQGKDILKIFYASQKNHWTIPVALEGWFRIKVGDYLINGRIDRIDKLTDGTLEIVDYKTGKAKEKVVGEDKNQLLIYQMAVEQLPEYKQIGRPGRLTYLYLNENTAVSFLGNEEEKTELASELLKIIGNIYSADFAPTPSQYLCARCDFRDICDYRA